MNISYLFSWFALIVFAFSLYDLFTAGKTPAIARALIRAALALLWLVSAKFQNGFILTGAVFMNVIVVFAGLWMVRGEVQIKNDEH
jgi:hypothetical protein